MKLVAKCAVPRFVVAVLSGALFLSADIPGDVPNLTGMAAGVVAVAFGGMGLLLGITAFVFWALDWLFTPRDDQRFPHS